MDRRQGPPGMHVDAVGSDDQQPPAHAVQLLAPFDVSRPLLVALSMLSPVILDDQLQVWVTQVEPQRPLSAFVAKDEVHRRLR